MKGKNLYYSLVRLVFLGMILALSSCGPVLVTSRHRNPPPPWFYPNRVELVRYVYFPELTLYYDLTARTYIYLDAGVWIRSEVLPRSYRGINLNRARYERIRNYRDDNIQRYHESKPAVKRRSNKTLKRKNS